MRRIKILYFDPTYTEYGAQISKAISSDEIDVNYLTCITTEYWKPSDTSDKNYHELKINASLLPIKEGSRGKYQEIISIPLLITITKTKPDVVIMDSNPALAFIYLLVAKMVGSKIIGFTSSLPNYASFWGKISDFVLKSNDSLIDQYVVPSSVKKDMMINLGIKENKINVIGNGIDTKKFGIEYTNVKTRIPLQKRIILFVGRFVPYKGIRYLIESFEIVNKQLNDVHLVLIGNGPEKHEIQQLIENKKLSNSISQIDNVINSEMPAYYSKADIIVVPSIEPEPFGLVYIEGMASGKPIITFDVGGGEKDLISDGKNGLIVKLKDINKLSSAMLELLENDQKRMEMGLYAKKFVEENYDFQVLASRWKKIIKDLTQQDKN